MAKNDYYELLGVAKGASEQEIKAAYKKSVMKYHPDRFATKGEAERKVAEDKFKEINHAYDVLGDPQKKANYDQFGSEEGMSGMSGGGTSGFGGGGFGDIFGDIFNSFMGGGSRSRANYPEEGDDIVMRLDITFDEAVFGCEKTVRVYRKVKCSTCNGSGASSSDAIKTCSSCNGSGRVVQTQRTIFGIQQVQTTCPTCGGKGKIITDKCRTCKGNGIIKEEKMINVRVPEGADDGQSVVFNNEGEAGRNGGRNGRLIIQLSVKAHPLFKRKGKDLYITMPLTFMEATIGAKIPVPTTKVPVTYAVPAGTQSGEMVRIKGYGVKEVNRSNYGDLYVTFKVETPTKLSKKQEELLKAFEDSLIDKQNESRLNFYNKFIKK